MCKIKKKNIVNIVVILLLILCVTGCKRNNILEYRSYGIDYLENGQYEDALGYFDYAIKLGNGDVGALQYDLLQYKAECLFMLNKYDEAKEIYNILMTVDKNNKNYKELYENVGSVVRLVEFKKALDDNDIEKADVVLQELKEMGLEHEKSVMYNQGVLYEKKGEWKNALNTFNYFLKQYPGDENALHEVDFIDKQLKNQ